MSTHTLMFEVLALAALCAPEAQSQPPVSLPDEMHIYRIESTFKWDGKLVKVELTGFKPKEREGIYTGLHGVAGAEEVVAISPVVSVGRVKMRLTHVDIKRDVAYLEPVPPKALPRGGLAQGKRKVEELKAGEVLWVVGYPIGIDLRPADTELKLRVLDPVARLTDIINPAARRIGQPQKPGNPSPYAQSTGSFLTRAFRSASGRRRLGRCWNRVRWAVRGDCQPRLGRPVSGR